MDSRERVMTAVAHAQPDRTPVSCGRIDDLDVWRDIFSVSDEEALRDHFQLDIRKTINSLPLSFATQNTKDAE